MGIPSYFRKILEDHPESHFWRDDMPVDNLLIDFNSMIYQVINLLNEELGSTLSTVSPINYENKLITRIIKQLQHVICEVIRPKKTVYIAVDGPPPFAKMIQQRARRYKTIKELNFKKELEKKYRITIPTLQWNKSAISPGTSFMVKLSKIIIQNIQQKNFQVHNEKLIVIFSDDSIAGEGEHKLLPSIRRMKSQQEINPEVSVIYSPDADLIVLTVMSGVKNIFILREPKDSDIELKYYKNHEFLYLAIDKCREEFCKQLHSGIGIQEDYYKEILKDYSFLTFICGNDFVIAAPFLKVKEGGIQLLMDAHKEIFIELNGSEFGDEPEEGKEFQFLVNSKNEVNNLFLMKLMKSLAAIEEDKLKKWQRKRDKVRQGMRGSKREVSEHDKEPWELELMRFSHEEYYSPLHPHYEFLNKVFDKIDYFTPEWNEQYNKHFFGNVDPTKVCEEYYKSLNFCLKYYYEGVPSWSWFYKYRAAPSIKQFSDYLEKNLLNLKVVWEPSSPCTPFEQLMYILPKQSFKLLPKVLNDGDLEEYYPKNFILDIVQGTKFIYSEPILPEIPIEVIQEKIRKVSDQFTVLEKERNTLRSKPYVHKAKA
jgi:5'-3' exonuclease